MGKVNPRKVFGKTIAELAEKYPEIVVLDADLGSSTYTGGFKKRFPERYIDCGVSEQDMMGTAAGLAIIGKKPYACTFAIFVNRAWEQIRQSIAYQGLDVKIIGTHGGFVGEDGKSHHGIEDVGIIRTLPMVCVVPSIEELGEVLYLTAEDKNPTYIRLFRHTAEIKIKPEIKKGKGFINGRDVWYIKPYRIKEGRDVTVVSNGYMLSQTFDLTKELGLCGIDAELISIPYVKPLDDEPVIESVKKTGKLVTIEDHRKEGGLGEAVSSVVSEKYPVKTKGLYISGMIGSGKCSELYDFSGLSVPRMKEEIYRWLKD